MTEREQLERTIAALEAQRASLGDAIVNAAVAALKEQLAALKPERSYLIPVRAERKPVTVMFADLAGFTSLSERADPETVRRLMNTCFDAFKAAIDRYGGHVDKYIGDEIMALFGAPVAYEDHAERALRAALALQAALQEVNARLARDLHLAHLTPELSNLKLHIGINSGLVVAGGIGAQEDQQYTVIGDAVNIAARLTDLSQAGQVLVGEATWQLAAPLFEFTLLPPVSLKGKQELQNIYALNGPKPQPGGVRGLEPLGLRAPLVGRAAEVERLRQALAGLQAGQGGVVSVVGEAGVGKSRLVAELRQLIPLAWHEGRCLSYGEMLSYHPFLGLLRDLLGVAPEAEVGVLETRLHQLLAELLPGRAAQLYPYLATLLGLPLDAVTQGRLSQLAGENLQWQAFQAFEQILAALADRSPVAIVLEDLHWIDPTSAALLEQVLPLTSRLPLLFILVRRPFGGAPCEQLVARLRSMPIWQAQVTVGPLSPAHSHELIWHLLAVETLPGAMRELILSRAEGNPLFLEEILRALIGQGVLRREGERWGVTPGVTLEQIELPATLQGVILARLDRLEAESKAILQMAAVIGRIFWYRVLNYIVSIEEKLDQMLNEHLARLEQQELIRQTHRSSDLEYIFKHVLIQDTAYHSLLKEQRQQFHRRVAEAITHIFAGNLEEHYGLLAHHYQVADDAQSAIHYLHLAGDSARRAYALLEAETYYRQALALLPAGDERRQHLLLDLGLVKLTQGDFGRAGEYYAAAFQAQHKNVQFQRRTFVRRPLRVYTFNAPRSLLPGLPIDIASAKMIYHLFAGLVEFDADLNIIPCLAERWEVDAQGCRYRFFLCQTARWSDGVPLTAHDFVYAWRTWLQPDFKSEAVSSLYVLRGARDYHQRRTDDPATVGVRAVDDFTLEVDLERPLAYFLSLLATLTFYPIPRHRWPPARAPWEDPAGYVCNGAFCLVDWQPGVGMTLERNPFYNGLSMGNVERVQIKLATGSADPVALYRADEFDCCWWEPYNFDAFAAVVPRECWWQKLALATIYCGLVPVPPLDDRRVRQALALTVDRAGLARMGLKAASIYARGGFVPPGMPGHSPELAPPYDPERARALLREAGYADGSALPPLRYAYDQEHAWANEVVSQWRQTLGIPIVSELTTFENVINRIYTSQVHLFPMIWVADYPDPHNLFTAGFLQSNVWRQPCFYAALDQVAQTFDVRRRMALYHELDRRLVVEEALCVPLEYNYAVAVTQPRVRYFPIYPVAYVPLKDVVMEDAGCMPG